jgi:CBS domain-containing protein
MNGAGTCGATVPRRHRHREVPMTTAGDIMHRGAQWIPAHETLDRAAQLMRQLDVGALPISDENERLCGILTDRDIVIGCVAMGHDPSEITAGDLAQGTPRWIDSGADVDEVLQEMQGHQIRRLPVIEDKRLVGMISEADLAAHLSDDQMLAWVESVYASS